MKAYVLHGVGDYRLEEVAVPAVKQGTVLVKVCAAGICGSDIPRIYETGAHVHPLIPGHEFAGEVVEVGEGVDPKWQGKRVGIFPLIPCRSCPQCEKRQYEMCEKYSYLGSRTDGGFAEYVQVPEWNLLELPEAVSMEQAAMLEPMAVAVHAIRRIQPLSTDKVAVCGLGTIGLLVVMFLQEMGCKEIYVAGNKDFQRDMAAKIGLGEDYFCDVREHSFPEWLLEKTERLGVDVFFDCVGKNEVLQQGLVSLAAKGKMMLLGNPASDVSLEKDLYWKILRKQLQLFGTWNSSFDHDVQDDWNYVLQKLQEQKIQPQRLITQRMTMDDFMHGFEIMRGKLEDYVKIMMIRGCREIDSSKQGQV